MGEAGVRSPPGAGRPANQEAVPAGHRLIACPGVEQQASFQEECPGYHRPAKRGKRLSAESSGTRTRGDPVAHRSLQRPRVCVVCGRGGFCDGAWCAGNWQPVSAKVYTLVTSVRHLKSKALGFVNKERGIFKGMPRFKNILKCPCCSQGISKFLYFHSDCEVDTARWFLSICVTDTLYFFFLTIIFFNIMKPKCDFYSSKGYNTVRGELFPIKLARGGELGGEAGSL